MLANVIGDNIEVGGRGRGEIRTNLDVYFNTPFFLQNYASEKVLTTYFVLGCLRNIFLKLLVSVFRGILWPNLDSVGDSKIIYDNNPICDVIELALHDVTADTTCQNGKCIDNCQNVLKIVY